MGLMLHVDLCCGLGGWQAPFEESPKWDTVGLDIRDDLNADVIGDVRALPFDCKPDLLTMSPPCTEFSTAWNRWCPLPDRDPDLSLYRACRAAVHELEPTYWVLENVAGAQRWFGPSTWSRHPWHLWGHFPPLDTGPLRPKGATWNQDPAETAAIPYTLADALRRAVEVWA